MGRNCHECLEEMTPCWPEPPGGFKVDCLDMDCPGHVELWRNAWLVASSYVFNCTGQKWPGKCWTETVRPCVPQKCPKSCECFACGPYEWLPLDDVFCFPVCEIESITIYPNPCQPETVTLTEGDGYRVEYVNGSQRLVLERTEGDGSCCPTFPRQELCTPLGEDCTWAITARTGCNPPAEVLRGVAAFAADIVKDCIERKCGLPRSVSAASFNGVSVNYEDGRGKSIDLQMLYDLLKKHEPKPVEQFLNPCQSVTFHHVDGPTRDEDIEQIEGPALDVTKCDEPEPEPLIAPISMRAG